MLRNNFKPLGTFPTKFVTIETVMHLIDGEEVQVRETVLHDYATEKRPTKKQYPTLKELLKAGVRPEKVTVTLSSGDLETLDRLSETHVEAQVHAIENYRESHVPTQETNSEPITTNKTE